MTTDRKPAAALNAAFALLAGAQAAMAAPNETGIWYDDTGKGAVRIEVCGDKLCGRIYWLKDPLNAEGKPLFDRHNPNEGQRKRPICGLQVIGGLAPMQNGEWDSGWIYDPKEGKSYSVAMQLDGPDTLKVTGYLVMRMMGRTLTWTRAPADLPGCATQAAKPATQPARADAPAKSKADTVVKPDKKAAAKKPASSDEPLPWAEK